MRTTRGTGAGGSHRALRTLLLVGCVGSLIACSSGRARCGCAPRPDGASDGCAADPSPVEERALRTSARRRLGVARLHE